MAKEKKKIATFYYRVSTKAEMQESSFHSQREDFYDYISYEPHCFEREPAKKLYCDYGQSGTQMKTRVGFIQMLKDAGLVVTEKEYEPIPDPLHPGRYYKQISFEIYADPSKKRLFDEIWVKDVTRLGRNIDIYGVANSLVLLGIPIKEFSGFSTDQKDGMAILRKKLDESMGFSERMSTNMQIFHRRAEKENRIAGTPYGYNYHPVKRKGGAGSRAVEPPRYTINEKEAEVVRRIFELCVEGYGTKAICTQLKKEGYRTKQNKPFATSSVCRILKNEKYKGLNTAGKFTNGSVFKKYTTIQIREDYKERLRESEGLPAIVTPELWDKAQECMQGRKIDGVPVHHPKHPFRNVLVCGYCGNHFVFDPSDKGSFRCSTKRNHGVSACQCTNVSVEQLDTLIDKLSKSELKSLMEHDFGNTIHSLLVLIERNMAALKDPSQTVAYSEKYTQLFEEVESLKKKQENMLALIDEETSESLVTQIMQKIKVYDTQIKEKELILSNILVKPKELENTLQELFELAYKEIDTLMTDNVDFNRDTIMNYVDSIKVFGKANTTSGGRPPKAILMPVLKDTIKASALLSVKPNGFTYKLRTNTADNAEYQAELDYYDQMDFSTERKLYASSKNLKPVEVKEEAQNLTKSQWPTTTVPFSLTPLEVDFDMGLEGISLVEQQKTYLDRLFQEYQSLKTDTPEN